MDLHVHSTASDGTLTPAEILARAECMGLGALAITDHDTVEGARAAVASGVPASIHFFTGIEISAAPPPFLHRRGSFHILGYGIRLEDAGLNAALMRLQQARQERNPAMVERLRRLGIDISMEELAAHAGNAQIGRPHIAGLMIRKGVVASFDEAFDRYIGTGKAAYVDKYRIPCEEAIQLIHRAGGIAVMAHPGLLGPMPDAVFNALISGLKRMGIDGIEVYYPEHTREQTERYRRTAGRFDLVITGGTDFHGDIKPGIDLGVGDGSFAVPHFVYEQLAGMLGGSGCPAATA
jgi:predicted metal-dependent phosphoesterase TrpH